MKKFDKLFESQNSKALLFIGVLMVALITAMIIDFIMRGSIDYRTFITSILPLLSITIFSSYQLGKIFSKIYMQYILPVFFVVFVVIGYIEFEFPYHPLFYLLWLPFGIHGSYQLGKTGSRVYMRYLLPVLFLVFWIYAVFIWVMNFSPP